MNMVVDFYPKKFVVKQEDPWNVKIIFDVNLVIRDEGNLAFWNKTESIISYISIENFEDPLYVLNTNGLVGNKINKTIYNPLVNENDVSNLSLHLEKSYYVASVYGPSFLDRLEGKKSSNENGIESLVYLPKLYSQGLPIYEKSAVDYIYFSSENPESFNVPGMPQWFRLDELHLNFYNITLSPS